MLACARVMRISRATRLVWALGLVASLVSTTHAAAAPAPDELTLVLAIDLPVTVGATVLLGVTEGLKNRIGPARCAWCDTPTSLDGFDRVGVSALSGADVARAALASDVLGFGVVPVLAIGLDLAAVLDARRPHRARRFAIDVMLIAEATATALAVSQLSKFALARRRPDAIAEPVDATRGVDENLSFFSGHSTLAFALASAAGTTSSLRHERLAPLVWTLGLGAATATAMLRVAGSRHFPSDVLTGALIGSAIGVIVPVLHRSRSPLALGGAVSSQAGMITVSGRLR